MSNFFCVVCGGQEATTGGGCARCGTAAGTRPFPVAAGRPPVTTIPATLACPVCNRSWALHDYNSGDHCPPAAPAPAGAPADDEKWRVRPGRLTWTEARSILLQGGAIQQDYAAGRYKSYEDFAARMDAAAREIEAGCSWTIPDTSAFVGAESVAHPAAGADAGDVTVPELTGCCANCGAKPEITMGPVNDTVCIGVKPTCDCIKRGAPYSSFNLWPAHGVSAKPATLRDEGMRVHHVAPDMRRGWCKCGHHRGEHGPIAGDAEHGLDEWGACLQCDCPLYAFDAEQTAAIREIISRSTPTERGACEFCGARNVPTDHVCAEAGGTERRE